jgi:ribokinase
MYDVITIGSSLVDIFISSSGFEADRDGDRQILTYGDKLELDDFHIFTGGGGSNTATAFARLGFEVAAISETGRDQFASFIVDDFQKEGIKTNLLIQEKLEKTGGAVILDGGDGARVVMVHRGAASMLDPYDIPSFWLDKSRWIHLSSIGGRQETLEKIFKVVSSSQNSKLSWNPGKGELRLLLDEVFDLSKIPCEIFFVNEEEWQMIEPVQEEILLNFPQVIVTKGKEGGDVYLYGKKTFRFKGQGVNSIDNTGAGDAFASAYVAAHLYHKKPEEAIAWGVKNAANVVSYFGAKQGLLMKEQLEEIINNSKTQKAKK